MLSPIHSRMEELVKSSTERLQDLNGRDGPLTGLDSHFESPKKRAVRKLARARKIRASVERLKEREQVLREDVTGELPQLKHDIARAKRLHAEYERTRLVAERKEGLAQKVQKHEKAVEQKAASDGKAVQDVRTALYAAKQGMSHQLVLKEENDWKRLQEMHQELITDKEEYAAARKRSCAAGGPCPPTSPDGLPYAG